MTARKIWPDELLALAATLAPVDAGRGRPRTVALRRAVSTAYYALFHELTIQAARELVGNDPVGNQASRWFAHADIRDLARAATGQKGAALAVVLGAPHPDLIRVADAFVTLQEARHRADYDHEYEVKRRDTLLLIETARDAVERLRKLRDTDDPSLRRFLKLMVGAVKIAKNR